MPFQCHYTGKKTTFGNKKAYGGAKITKGGFGLKTTGVTRRTFKPNLHKMSVLLEDEKGVKRSKRVYVSAEAIRAGMVTRPLKRKYGYTRQQNESQD